MLDNPKLTARQQQILDLIQTAIARTGAPPTRAEIAAELGFKSANAAEEHLQALARKGVIELVSGTSRGIRLQSDTLRALNQQRGKQFSLPLPSLAQLSLPLVGRVAAEEAHVPRDEFDGDFPDAPGDRSEHRDPDRNRDHHDDESDPDQPGERDVTADEDAWKPPGAYLGTLAGHTVSPLGSVR